MKQNGISVESSVTAGEGALVGMEYRILRDGKEFLKLFLEVIISVVLAWIFIKVR